VSAATDRATLPGWRSNANSHSLTAPRADPGNERAIPVLGWLPELGSPVVGQRVFLPISAAARTELIPLALVVVVRVPNVQMKQAPERLHLRSITHKA